MRIPGGVNLTYSNSIPIRRPMADMSSEERGLHASAPSFSTRLQHEASAPRFSTTLQHHASAPRFSTALQHRASARSFSTALQHHASAPRFSTALQHHASAPRFSTAGTPRAEARQQQATSNKQQQQQMVLRSPHPAPFSSRHHTPRAHATHPDLENFPFGRSAFPRTQTHTYTDRMVLALPIHIIRVSNHV